VRNISLGIGLLIALFFIGLLSIEFCQDKRLERQYPNIRKNKMALENGKFECQFCGNRQITVMDKICVICGVEFDNQNDKCPKKFIY